MQRRRKTANMAFVVTSIVSRLSLCATRLYNVGVVSHVNYWVFGLAIATDQPRTAIATGHSIERSRLYWV